MARSLPEGEGQRLSYPLTSYSQGRERGVATPLGEQASLQVLGGQIIWRKFGCRKRMEPIGNEWKRFWPEIMNRARKANKPLEASGLSG